MIIALAIGFGALVLMLAYAIAGLIRNNWVYRVRMGLLAADFEGAYQRLPSVDYMMRKWWIWDATKFIDMPDDTEARKHAKHLAFGKRIMARRQEGSE